MLTIISPRNIIHNHWDSLRLYHPEISGKGARDWATIALFLGLPVLFTLIFLVTQPKISDSIISTLTNGLAIFAGFLFNLLALLHSFSQKEPEHLSGGLLRTYKVLRRQTYSNTLYAILCSLISIIFLILYSFAFATAKVIYFSFSSDVVTSAQVMFGASSVFFITQFFLTLFMILKRMDVIAREEFLRGSPID